MKSQIYNLSFLVFLVLNGSLHYTGILKDIALNKESKMIVPISYVQSFGVEISRKIEGKSNFNGARGDFFKFNNQKFIFDGKIVGYLTPLFPS
jgi:hypothetical protein